MSPLERLRKKLVEERDRCDTGDCGSAEGFGRESAFEDAIALLDQEAASPSWLPLESAPKDGTLVKLLFQHEGLGYWGQKPLMPRQDWIDPEDDLSYIKEPAAWAPASPSPLQGESQPQDGEK